MLKLDKVKLGALTCKSHHGHRQLKSVRRLIGNNIKEDLEIDRSHTAPLHFLKCG